MLKSAERLLKQNIIEIKVYLFLEIFLLYNLNEDSPL